MTTDSIMRVNVMKTTTTISRAPIITDHGTLPLHATSGGNPDTHQRCEPIHVTLIHTNDLENYTGICRGRSYPIAAPENSTASNLHWRYECIPSGGYIHTAKVVRNTKKSSVCVGIRDGSAEAFYDTCTLSQTTAPSTKGSYHYDRSRLPTPTTVYSPGRQYNPRVAVPTSNTEFFTMVKVVQKDKRPRRLPKVHIPPTIVSDAHPRYIHAEGSAVRN